MEYWENLDVKKRRPPPPPHYYARRREKVEYSRNTYLLGALFVLGILIVAMVVPYFLLRYSSNKHFEDATNLYYSRQYYSALHEIDLSIKEFGVKNAESCILAGIILTYHVKNHEFALKYIDKGLGYTDYDSLRGELLYLKGINLHRAKRHDEALKAFNKVTDSSSKLDSALFEIGLNLTFKKSLPDSALEVFNQLLIKNDRFNEARYYRAFNLQKLDMHKKAITDWDLLLQKDFEVGAVYYHKARSEIALGKMDDACLDLRMALNYQLPEAQHLFNLHCLDQNHWFNNKGQ